MISGNYSTDDLNITNQVSNNLYYVDTIESVSRSLRRFHNYIKYQQYWNIIS